MWFLWAWVKKSQKIQGPTNNCCQLKFDICSIHIFVSFLLLLFSSNLTIVYISFFPRRKQPRTSINAFISFARILNYDVVNSERWLSHHPGPPRMFYCVHRTSSWLWNAWLLLSVLVSKLSNHGLYFLNWYCYIINKISQFGFDQTHSSVLSLIDNSLCPVPVSRNKIATDQRSLWFIDSMSLKSPSKVIISLICNKGMRLIFEGLGFYLRKYGVIQPKVSL